MVKCKGVIEREKEDKIDKSDNDACFGTLKREKKKIINNQNVHSQKKAISVFQLF